jgi:hypothetical protein
VRMGLGVQAAVGARVANSVLVVHEEGKGRCVCENDCGQVFEDEPGSEDSAGGA